MLESVFFQDLAILMTVAGIIAIAFSRFGWPKVLGYILAGILMSEYTWGGCFLKDVGSTKIIGQLGVVFLMFGMGLSFSAKDMRKIRAVALPSAVLDTLVMIWLGFTVGTKFFGWSAVQSVFLGVAICDSATTLLAKVIGEMGWERRQFAKYVLGTSVCEDIICVGAIAVATGFAQGGTMSARAFLASLGGLGVFFLTVLVFGFVLVPRLLASVAKRKDDESLLLAVLGVCFFVSFIAYKFEFSLALGAFLVGLLGASSDVRQRLEGLVGPLKSMFSAVFFVSIGLMVNPHALWNSLPQILLVSAVIVVGKTFNNTIASLAAGVDIKTSVQNGMSLAQTGEFAFMVAILYAGIKGTDDNPMFEIAVGSSLLTTLLNPLMVRLSDKTGDMAVRRLPDRFKRMLSIYHAWFEKIRNSDDSPAFILLRAAALKLGVYAVLMLSVSVVCAILYRFDYSRFSVFFEHHDEAFFFVLANLFSLALMPMVVSASRALADEIAELLAGDGSTKWVMAARQLIRFVVLVAVVALFFIEWTMINLSVLPMTVAVQGASAVVICGVGIFGWRFFVKAGRRATSRFQEALTAEERREGLARTMSISVPEGYVRRLRLDADSPAIGETVATLNVRAKTGASVVSVIRGDQVARNIGPDWEFKIGDIVVAIGEQGQIAALKDLLGVTE